MLHIHMMVTNIVLGYSVVSESVFTVRRAVLLKFGSSKSGDSREGAGGSGKFCIQDH